MGREDDEYKIRREFERRKEKEQEAEAESRGEKSGPEVSQDFLQKLNEMLERAEPLILAVHASYNQFAAGVEFSPPYERRKQLDQMMLSLQMMSKPTPSYRFRYNGVLTTYNTYKQRWEKMMADLESGKIKRTVPARRKSSF